MNAPTQGQLALAAMLARGGSPDGGAISHVDARVYTSPDRFVAEQAQIFAHVPIAIAPSALLPANNMAVPHDGFGKPLLRTGRRMSSSTSAATAAPAWSRDARW
ncbi:hypothetical protein [Sphingomonas sp. M1-B02]|uniref:hypothetical protein n=1 Tax=Sphingomonas sp. M1-B02 TaxID=3114300 RepID=UPI002AD55803|nr:hypothetical protein [Sphingomonas sp. S6-11]